MPAREFHEFTDPDGGMVWKVDISFLTSRWGCIFGQGCPGIYPPGSGKSSTHGGCCTLGVYLDSGGNYDRTADALIIHRSTLRYRLGRIREVSGRDVADPDSRLNLHLSLIHI